MLTNEKALATIHSLPLTDQVAFYILCTLSIIVNNNDAIIKKEWYCDWANAWLLGRDRSGKAADNVYIRIYDPDNPYLGTCMGVATAALLAAECLDIEHGANLILWLSKAEGRTMAFYPEVIIPILTKYFVCPHCYSLSYQHTASGKCLFGAHTWEGINNVWRP